MSKTKTKTRTKNPVDLMPEPVMAGSTKVNKEDLEEQHKFRIAGYLDDNQSRGLMRGKGSYYVIAAGIVNELVDLLTNANAGIRAQAQLELMEIPGDEYDDKAMELSKLLKEEATYNKQEQQLKSWQSRVEKLKGAKRADAPRLSEAGAFIATVNEYKAPTGGAFFNA